MKIFQLKTLILLGTSFYSSHLWGYASQDLNSVEDLLQTKRIESLTDQLANGEGGTFNYTCQPLPDAPQAPSFQRMHDDFGVPDEFDLSARATCSDYNSLYRGENYARIFIYEDICGLGKIEDCKEVYSAEFRPRNDKEAWFKTSESKRSYTCEEQHPNSSGVVYASEQNYRDGNYFPFSDPVVATNQSSGYLIFRTSEQHKKWTDLEVPQCCGNDDRRLANEEETVRLRYESFVEWDIIRAPSLAHGSNDFVYCHGKSLDFERYRLGEEYPECDTEGEPLILLGNWQDGDGDGVEGTPSYYKLNCGYEYPSD